MSINFDCSFNGYSSSDADGSVQQWWWDFGDGTGGYGPYQYHYYRLPGQYTVTMTVYDNNGAPASTASTVTAL